MNQKQNLIEAAKRRITEMDSHERQAGFATPQDSGPTGVMRTSIFALRAALEFLENGDEDQAEECIADAMVMLVRGSDSPDSFLDMS